jgi:hypothetical protein
LLPVVFAGSESPSLLLGQTPLDRGATGIEAANDEPVLDPLHDTQVIVLVKETEVLRGPPAVGRAGRRGRVAIVEAGAMTVARRAGALGVTAAASS